MNDQNFVSIYPFASPLSDTSALSDRSLYDMIGRRAYELYEQRGGERGHEVVDWLRAEREIKHHLGLP